MAQHFAEFIFSSNLTQNIMIAYDTVFINFTDGL